MNLRQKRDIRRLARQIIQIIFFLWMRALYTSAFSGVRYVIEQIRAGKPIEQNAFLVMLIALCGLTILFGRFFCGYACAFGTLGDGMYALSQWVQKKLKKKLPWVSEETGRKLQKMKYIVLLVLMLIYALGFTKKFHGTSPWEVFSMLYTGKIPDLGYLAGWVIFVLILVGMCLKERFFCQYLCPMGAIFAWLPVLPFSVLDRDRSNCIASSLYERNSAVICASRSPPINNTVRSYPSRFNRITTRAKRVCRFTGSIRARLISTRVLFVCLYCLNCSLTSSETSIPASTLRPLKIIGASIP